MRREDKGHRFVIADAETEDNMIESHLNNAEQFTEILQDPTEEYIIQLKTGLTKVEGKVNWM